MTAPCWGCPERHESCHGQCERYQAYRAVKDEECRRRKLYRDTEFVRSANAQKAKARYLCQRKREGK